MAKIFLNPGHHPGVDPGAVSELYGVTEADIVARVCSFLKKYLIDEGHEVKVIQSDNLNGENPRYINVCGTANEWGADLFICVHCNAFTSPAANGVECFYYSETSQGKVLAGLIQQEIVNSLDIADRGVKCRPKLRVLKRTTMTAAYVELGFISNEWDVVLLMHKKEVFARAIARAVIRFLEM